MRFALFLWNEFVDDGTALPPHDVAALTAYLARLQSEGIPASIEWFSMAPASRWTRGAPNPGGIVAAPGFDPTGWYREAELAGVVTIECEDSDAALLCASWFPLPIPIEVRPIVDGIERDDSQALMSASTMREVALGYWGGTDNLDWYRADDIVMGRPDLVPSLLRALAETASPAQLSLIGVGPLESLSIQAEHAGRPDPTIDLLLAAGLSSETMARILMGPWPHYLEKWDIAERLKDILSEQQITWLLTRGAEGSATE